jgi:hypothetical protein
LALVQKASFNGPCIYISSSSALQKFPWVTSMVAYGAGAAIIRYLADGQHVFIAFNIEHFQRGKGNSESHHIGQGDTEQLAGIGGAALG